MKRILVTGCCGFIGSVFVRQELETYPELTIVNFDKLIFATSYSQSSRRRPKQQQHSASNDFRVRQKRRAGLFGHGRAL